MGSFSINDYRDYEADKINGLNDRPLVNGAISRSFARWFSIAALVIVLGLSFLLPIVAQMIALGSTIIFYVYSLGGKKILGLKNFLVALSYFLVALLGTLLENLIIEPIVWFGAVISIIMGFASEVLFDIGDVKGDTSAKVHTFANKYSKKTAAWIVACLLFLVALTNWLPAFILIDERVYKDFLFLGLMLFTVTGYATVGIIVLTNQEQKTIKLLRKLLMGLMQFGVLSFLIGVLVN